MLWMHLLCSTGNHDGIVGFVYITCLMQNAFPKKSYMISYLRSTIIVFFFVCLEHEVKIHCWISCKRALPGINLSQFFFKSEKCSLALWICSQICSNGATTSTWDKDRNLSGRTALLLNKRIKAVQMVQLGPSNRAGDLTSLLLWRQMKFSKPIQNR